MESPLADIRIGKVTEQWALNQKIPTKYFETTSSTNTLAKNEAFDILTTEQQLVIYLTDEQTAGRGRKTNTWANAHIGSQLLTTWSFHIEKALSPAISPLMGLALYKAATATWPFLNFSLKAPNDLYLNNKKVSGLLLESVSQGNKYRFFIGLGFNVIASPASVDTSTSLVEELPTEAPLLAEDWICFLERLIFEFSIALQQGLEPLNSTSCKSLITALNKWPLLTEKYLSIDQSGNLQTATKKISWLEL